MVWGLPGFSWGRSERCAGWALLLLALPVRVGEMGGIRLSERIPTLQEVHELVLGTLVAIEALLELGLWIPHTCSSMTDIKNYVYAYRSICVCVCTGKGIAVLLE